MRALYSIFLILLCSQISCGDLGTDIHWSEWVLLKCGPVSIHLPPHSEYIGYYHPPETVSGVAYVEDATIFFSIYYAPDLRREFDKLYDALGTREESTVSSDGYSGVLVRSHTTNYPETAYLFVPAIGDGRHQLLLTIWCTNVEQRYIIDHMISSIRVGESIVP